MLYHTVLLPEELQPQVLICRTLFTMFRNAEVGDLVEKMEALLRENKVLVQEKKAEATRTAVQWEACFQLVEQFKSTLSESGQDCSIGSGEEEMAAAIEQPGIGPVLKMYFANVKKLNAFAAMKSASESDLLQASTAMTATSRRLVALQAYSQELAAGKDAVLMRPLPSCNKAGDYPFSSSQPLLPAPLECAICSDGFSFWDVLLCTCRHVYHPWCAVQWFRMHVMCAVPQCGLVSPIWYKSWGFGQYDSILKALEDDMQKSSLPALNTADVQKGRSQPPSDKCHHERLSSSVTH